MDPDALLDHSISESDAVVTYSDEINRLSTDPGPFNEFIVQLERELAYVVLPTEPSKRFIDVYRSTYSVALGLIWWREGILLLNPSSVVRLWGYSSLVPSSRYESPQRLASLVLK